MSEDIERILSREALSTENYAAGDKLKIGIIGLSEGAGASFLTGCFARYLANTGKHSPAVVELGSGSLYDSYGMDKRFAGRPWFRFYQALTVNRNIRGKQNPDEGINWILKTPDEAQIRLTFEQKLILINHARGDVILCDLSGEAEPDARLLRSMDQIIAVIDPMPSKMLSGYQALCKLKELATERESVLYVLNKMNRGVNRRQMLEFLKVRKPFFLPLVNPECVYSAEYNCKIPYADTEVRNAIQSPLEQIAAALFFA